MSKKLFAEFFGTFWLVFAGCGSAIFAGSYIGNVGVSLAFGLTVLSMAYAVGHISGGHFNPAVTLGLVVSGRFSAAQSAQYMAAQLLGALAAGGCLWLIASGKAEFSAAAGFAANGYGEHSPDNYGLWAVLLAEVLLTAFFLLVILGATDKRAPAGFAPVAIGLVLTLIHLVSIPLSNTSVNPARSTGVALFQQGAALQQLWLFWVAPLVGALVGALLYRCLLEKKET